MALGRQVGDHVRLELPQSLGHGLGVADVGLDKGIAVAGRHRLQRAEHARVGQLVIDQDLMVRMLDQPPHQGRADETGAAGDKNSH